MLLILYSWIETAIGSSTSTSRVSHAVQVAVTSVARSTDPMSLDVYKVVFVHTYHRSELPEVQLYVIQ
jgi:hypothetical protein